MTKYSRAKKSNCSTCPLRDETRVWGQGKTQARVAIIGEAPGSQEATVKEPFVGPAGKWLSAGISNAGYKRSAVWLTNVLSCFPGNTSVTYEPGKIEVLYRRFYTGPMIVVKTSRGVLTGTPNHPVLTQRGLVALNKLTKSDYLINSNHGRRMGVSNPNIQNTSSSFEKLFSSLSKTLIRVRMVGGNMDFHGDGKEADVDIIATNDFLRNNIKASGSKFSNKELFKPADETTVVSLANSHTASTFIRLFRGSFPSLRGLMRRVHKMVTFLDTTITPTLFHRGGTITDRNTTLYKSFLESTLTHSMFLRKFLRTNTTNVTFDGIRKIKHFKFSGHVYNLQTSLEQYTANGYIVSNCRPPENEIMCAEAIEAKKNCRPGFEAELARLKNEGVRVLIPVGNTALKALGINESISKARGSVYERDGFFVVPTYHPSYIMRGQVKEEGTWIGDLKKAFEIAEKPDWKPPKENFILFPKLKDIQTLDKWVRKTKPLTAVDIETWQGKIFCIGFGFSPEDAVVVPIYRRGGHLYWKNTEWKQVREIISGWLNNFPLMFQNALFDLKYLRAEGFLLDDYRLEHDIMLLHHCLAEDTLIDTLDFGKIPIKELAGKKDFWVVSHDGEKLVPGKVRKVWKTAKQRDDMVRVVFWSKTRGDKSNMWIDCTSDHRIPTQNRGWVEAGDLKAGDRLIRGQQNVHVINKKRIHRWVWENINNKSLGDLQIHHVDGNHWNNNPNNLQPVTVSEHNQYHLDSQYRATIKMVRNAKERLKKEFDADEVYHLYFNVGLSGREVAKELNVYYDRVVSLFKSRGWKTRSRSEATKLRWEKDNNCRVISVVPLNRKVPVYDMTVEKTCNYSANGIIVSNSIHPEIYHNLGYIVSIYGDTPFWKDISFKNIASTDDAELRTYNARDCVVLHQVLGPMLADLEEFQVTETYYHVSLPLVKPVLSMTETGMKINQYRLKKWRTELEERIVELEKTMREVADLPECFKFSSGDHLRKILYNEVAPQFENAKKELKEYDIPGTRKKKNSKKYRELVDRYAVGFSTKALHQTKATKRKTDSGLYSTDKEAILAIEIAGKARLNELGQFKRKTAGYDNEKKHLEQLLKFCALLRQWNELAKLYSTYTTFATDEQGRVHAQFKIHGTATGRLSSNSPNMQNIPASAKRIFVPEKDYIFIEADYSNLELRILAYLCDDRSSIEVFEAGGNIHDENTKQLFALTPEDPMWKVARHACKTYRFGRNYGGGLYGIYARVMEQVPDLPLTFAKFKEVDAEYEKLHPNYKRWYYDTLRKVKKERVLKNPFGRQRIFLGQDYQIEKEGVNFPIQSGAADVINPATVRIWERLKGIDARLVAQVHDSLMVECRKSLKKKVTGIMKDEMERPVTIGKYTITLPVDFKAGSSWGELKDV